MTSKVRVLPSPPRFALTGYAWRSHAKTVRPKQCRFYFKYDSAIPRRDTPELCVNCSPRKTEGAGNAGCPMHPQPRVRSLSEAHERSHHGHTGFKPGIPRAMVLRLISCSPRRRIRLVTVIRGLRLCLHPVGPTSLREFNTSNGCQNDTASPYAKSADHLARRTSLTRFISPCDCLARLTPLRPPHPAPRS